MTGSSNRAASQRRGSILILIAGLASVLITMTLAFLMRMRSDLEESRRFVRDIQARTMLTAALMYLTETSRLGWESTDPTTPSATHAETYGWIDVRDGSPGPRYRDGMPVGGMLADGSGAAFPAAGGRAARCPMQVMERPPFAIRSTMVANPIDPDETKTWRDRISYKNSDPRAVRDDDWAEFARGDRRPRSMSTALAWFRIYRKPIVDVVSSDADDPGVRRSSPAVFVISCGAGASHGFRDWAEVVAAGEQDRFGSEPDFTALRADETILWYEAEWNPAVSQNIEFHYRYSGLAMPGTYEWEDINRAGGHNSWTQQFGGTFLYIRRLDQDQRPTIW
jgi:hypothetical protein